MDTYQLFDDGEIDVKISKPKRVSRRVRGFPYRHGIVYRRISSSTDMRTGIACAWDGETAYGHTTVLIGLESARASALWLANFNSIPFDYCLRQSVGQATIEQYDIDQMPTPTKDEWEHEYRPHESAATYCIDRVVVLQFTERRYARWARELRPATQLREWQPPEERIRLIAEIDACVASLYPIEPDDLEHMYSSFPILERKQRAAHGSYLQRDIGMARFREYWTRAAFRRTRERVWERRERDLEQRLKAERERRQAGVPHDRA